MLKRLVGFLLPGGSKSILSSSNGVTKRGAWPTAPRCASVVDRGNMRTQCGLLGGADTSLSSAALTWLSSATWEGISMSEKRIKDSAALKSSDTLDATPLSNRHFSKQSDPTVADIKPFSKPRERIHQRRINSSATSCDSKHRNSVDLPYQSIVSLAMPPRPFRVPGSPNPAPDPSNLPFGKTEDYSNSMIIHYVDELQMTYAAATRKYNKMFPHHKLSAWKLRHRHIQCLLRLKKRFRVKTEQELASLRDVNLIVQNRGTKYRKRFSDTESVDSTVVTPETLQHPVLASLEPSTKDLETCSQVAPRLFEKVCIVVWRDAEARTWKQIKDRLEEKYQWSVGKTTVKKHYNSSLDRVYGVGGKDMRNLKQGEGEEKRMRRVG
jgi:hypothetical protein